MLYYVRCGGRNTCEPSGNVSCPKIFVNTIVDDVYSIKLTWIDLMNGNSMDIQQIIRILSQSLNLVIWNSILESAMSVKKQQRLMMARLDVWWWGLSCWVVSCVGSTKQKMMVHFFSDFVVQLWQFFFYEMIQTGRKTVLLSAIIAFFIFWGRPLINSSLTTKLGKCGFLSERQISRNHSRNLVTSYLSASILNNSLITS